jgi:hypothetical protein
VNGTVFRPAARDTGAAATQIAAVTAHAAIARTLQHFMELLQVKS